ncbi:unnamed protein product [Closterium sp. NIES-53]
MYGVTLARRYPFPVLPFLRSAPPLRRAARVASSGRGVLRRQQHGLRRRGIDERFPKTLSDSLISASFPFTPCPCAPPSSTPLPRPSVPLPSAPPSTLLPISDVLRVWRAADAVCFDVDSTVCVDEGIDELAAYCGAGEAVAAWTTKAMSGSVPFETALAARLEIFNPSAADVAGFLRDHPPRLNPGIGELVRRLKARGTEVYLISGGFRQMIEPVAALLDIPVTNIFANRLLFEEGSGAYSGFDANEPTSRSGGKARAIVQLKQEHGFKRLVMVGDGATDLEARQPGGADMFIGYGGIQVRKVVAAESDWFAMDFQHLIDNV